MLGKAIT
jgi:hypothetical protein